MKKYVLTMPDGSVQIMETVGDIHPGLCLAKWPENTPKPVSMRPLREGEAIPDRTFRNAWRDNRGLSVDMDGARRIHMDRIRTKRNARLKELDGRQYGPEFDGLRQKLRDIPQTLDLSKAETPDDLKMMWPEELP